MSHATQGLRERKLTLVDATSQSVGAMGPTVVAALFIPLIAGANAAGKGAGAAVPLAFVLAGIGALCLGWLVSRFATRIRASGSLYSYVTDAFGGRVGMLAGWVYYAGYIAFTLSFFLFVGGITSDFLSSAYGVHIDYWILDLIIIVAVAVASMRGARLSTRAQLTLALTSMAIVFGYSIYIVASLGSANSARPFSPGTSPGGIPGISFAILYAMLVFVGFETAANLGEETKDPFRSIPRAMLTSLGIVLVFEVLVSYAVVLAFHLDANTLRESASPLLSLAGSGRYGTPWFGDLLNILVIIDVLAVCLGLSNAVGRGVYAMARDQRLPKVLARCGRLGTPWVAIATIAVLSIAEIVLVAASNGLLSRFTGPEQPLLPAYEPVFGWLQGLGALCITAIYVTVAVGGVGRLWQRVTAPAVLAVTGVIAVAVFAGAFWGGIYRVPSPENTAPWVLLGIVVAGAIAVISLWRAYRPEDVRPTEGVAAESGPQAQ